MISLFRFQNSNLPKTFLYAGEQEAESIRSYFPNFIDEGLAFNVFSQPADSLIPLKRFQNSNVPGTYLYATEEESVDIRLNSPNFIEEGVAFFAYGPDANIGEDIYRFENTQIPETYIYVEEEGRQDILDNYPQFVEDGVIFEAISAENHPITFFNSPPTLVNPITNQVVAEDSAFNFTFADNTFNDVDAGD